MEGYQMKKTLVALVATLALTAGCSVDVPDYDAPTIKHGCKKHKTKANTQKCGIHVRRS